MRNQKILDTVICNKTYEWHHNASIQIKISCCFFALHYVMHRIYQPTRKDTRYLCSSIAYLYSSKSVDKVKTQHALAWGLLKKNTHTSGDVTHSLESFPTLQSWKCSDWSVSGMSSFSLVPSCGDEEGDDTAVKPSSTLRILNFFIFSPVRETEGDESTESRSAVDDEGESRSRSFLQQVSLNLTF